MSLVSFLADWLHWAENGAPDGEPYARNCGLCFNAGEYGDAHETSVIRELKEALFRDFVDTGTPFDTVRSYMERKRDNNHHENPSRLEWVRDQLAAVKSHRGWVISLCWFGYEATHPDYDPTPVYTDDGPSDNRVVTATTRAGVIREIDIWFEEND